MNYDVYYKIDIPVTSFTKSDRGAAYTTRIIFHLFYDHPNIYFLYSYVYIQSNNECVYCNVMLCDYNHNGFLFHFIIA